MPRPGPDNQRRNVNADELKQVIEKHRKWRLGEEGGQRAYLRGADLQGAYLQGAYLQGAIGIAAYRCTPLLMLLDQPGPIRAYKLVNEKREGPFNGGIVYEIGQTYEIADANTDVAEQCGAGINLATLDWCMREWRGGYRILVAEFTAADIAAIPTATDGKFRVRKATIVGEKNLTEIGLVTEKPQTT